MADNSPDQILEAIVTARTPEQVDEGFKALKTLGVTEQKSVVDTVEMFFVDNFKAFAPIVKQEVADVRQILEELKGTGMIDEIMGAGPMRAQVVEPFQTQAQTAWRIHEFKGEDTDPLIKSMIEKTAKLSSDDYNSVYGAISVLMEMVSEFGPPDNNGPARGFPPKGGPKFGF